MLHSCACVRACVCVHTTHELGPSPKSHVLCASLLSDICAAVVCLKKEYGQLTYVIRDDVVLVVLVHNIVSFLSRKVVHCESYPIVMSTHP